MNVRHHDEPPIPLPERPQLEAWLRARLPPPPKRSWWARQRSAESELPARLLSQRPLSVDDGLFRQHRVIHIHARAPVLPIVEQPSHHLHGQHHSEGYLAVATNGELTLLSSDVQAWQRVLRAEATPLSDVDLSKLVPLLCKTLLYTGNHAFGNEHRVVGSVEELRRLGGPEPLPWIDPFVEQARAKAKAIDNTLVSDARFIREPPAQSSAQVDIEPLKRWLVPPRLESLSPGGHSYRHLHKDSAWQLTFTSLRQRTLQTWDLGVECVTIGPDYRVAVAERMLLHPSLKE